MATPLPTHSPAARERTAWLVLWSAFAACIALSITLPLLGLWGYRSATATEHATLQSTSGTVRLTVAGQRDPIAVSVSQNKGDVVEETTIYTDSRAQALLTLPDRSTLTIYPNSTLTINRMRRPRFDRGKASEVVVTLLNGRVRTQISPTSSDNITLTIHTPHATGSAGGIQLGIAPFASYAVEVVNDQTLASVRSGAAVVAGQTGSAVILHAGERAEIPLGAAARGPFAAEHNLIQNSALQNPQVARPISSGILVERWEVRSDQGGDGGTVDGTVEINTLGSSRAMHFLRTNSGNNHGETAVYQNLNRLVADYRSLTLRLDVTIVSQSLGGGGEQSSEFPLMVRVDYTDISGKPEYWTYGFYCENPLGYHIIGGTSLTCNARRTFEFDLRALIPLAQRFDRLTIYASGWDWESSASDIELIAE